jgi:hypothetical protein
MNATIAEPIQPEQSLAEPTQNSWINETFYNESNYSSARNDSNASPPSPDQSQLSLNGATWLPLSLGTVEASTVLPIGFLFKPKKQVFCTLQKL